MGFSIMDILIPGTLDKDKQYPAWAVKATDHFIGMTKNKDIWEVLDLMVDVWIKKNSQEAQKHAQEVKLEQETRKNHFASTERSNGDLGGQRALGEIPYEIGMILDMFYHEKIEEIGQKKFYYKFFKRYPQFKVAQKL